MVTSTADAETIYDDFDGTELDFSKWDITAQHGSALDSVANSVLTMTAPGGGFTMHPDPTGDFDLNTFVDGEDFLLWQRGGSAVPLSPTELAVWEANYGSLVPLATSVTAVPEPSTLIILLFGMTTLLSHRRTVV